LGDRPYGVGYGMVSWQGGFTVPGCRTLCEATGVGRGAQVLYLSGTLHVLTSTEYNLVEF